MPTVGGVTYPLPPSVTVIGLIPPVVTIPTTSTVAPLPLPPDIVIRGLTVYPQPGFDK